MPQQTKKGLIGFPLGFPEKASENASGKPNQSFVTKSPPENPLKTTSSLGLGPMGRHSPTLSHALASKAKAQRAPARHRPPEFVLGNHFIPGRWPYGQADPNPLFNPAGQTKKKDFPGVPEKAFDNPSREPNQAFVIKSPPGKYLANNCIPGPWPCRHSTPRKNLELI